MFARIFGLAFLSCASLVEPACSMTFTARSLNVEPTGAVNYVYGEGQIRSGDADRLQMALQSVNAQPGTPVELFLDSPGGSLKAGLELGRYIAGLNVLGLDISTNVGRETPDPRKPHPGSCSSACVFAYLGGRYRYLHEGSRIGVHQFAFGDSEPVDGAVALSIGQSLSAEIVEFIRQQRADTALFKLMSETDPSEILFISSTRLRELRVVTDAIFDESWSFEFAEGVTYLRIWQQSAYGENKLIMGCDSGKLMALALVQPPRDHSVGRLPQTIGVFLDAALYTVPENLVREKPFSEGRYIRAAFEITPQLARKFLVSESMGVAVQPPNQEIFIGFNIRTAKGRDKLLKLLTDCPRRR